MLILLLASTTSSLKFSIFNYSFSLSPRNASLSYSTLLKEQYTSVSCCLSFHRKCSNRGRRVIRLGVFTSVNCLFTSNFCHEPISINIENRSSCLFQLAVVRCCGCLLEYLVTSYVASITVVPAGWPPPCSIGIIGGLGGNRFPSLEMYKAL